jgi:tryptophan synthase beta chain
MMKTNRNGYFGAYGGCYVPETLMPALRELREGFGRYIKDGEFRRELAFYLAD